MAVKTPNPKCCLYWCLIEFIDWRYSQSYWYFRPALWTIAALTFFLVSSPSCPLSCVNHWISILYYSILYRRIQCVGGEGETWGHGREGDIRQIKHLPQSPFTCLFFLKMSFGNASANLSTVIMSQHFARKGIIQTDVDLQEVGKIGFGYASWKALNYPCMARRLYQLRETGSLE